MFLVAIFRMNVFGGRVYRAIIQISLEGERRGWTNRRTGFYKFGSVHVVQGKR
jgi:hypothetical protein